MIKFQIREINEGLARRIYKEHSEIHKKDALYITEFEENWWINLNSILNRISLSSYKGVVWDNVKDQTNQTSLQMLLKSKTNFYGYKRPRVIGGFVSCDIAKIDSYEFTDIVDIDLSIGCEKIRFMDIKLEKYCRIFILREENGNHFLSVKYFDTFKNEFVEEKEIEIDELEEDDEVVLCALNSSVAVCRIRNTDISSNIFIRFYHAETLEYLDKKYISYIHKSSFIDVTSRRDTRFYNNDSKQFRCVLYKLHNRENDPIVLGLVLSDYEVGDIGNEDEKETK